MSKPGCCCKSANETSPNCVYCRNKNQVTYDDNNYYQNDYNNQNQYAYDPYGQYGYGQGSEYSYDKDGGYSTGSQYSDGEQDNSNWDLVKPVLVFGVGCFLTSQMVNVANELG
ncbi:uncharacterized protein LOC117573796 [Drosophila albomicans]|uniref:Uncharacterized protein LOC117573796 n=1 Tax=Drosophila albomicans TaxID=7291 RepID=A0A6P8XP57_DROAB|nr:uncharacterized protein LOC117573796 [Drosophila albomicans]